MKQPFTTKRPIIIDDHAGIGMGPIMLSEAHIGEHAVAAAISVVTHGVPADAIVAGNAARMVLTRGGSESALLKVANSA